MFTIPLNYLLIIYKLVHLQIVNISINFGTIHKESVIEEYTLPSLYCVSNTKKIVYKTIVSRAHFRTA